MTITFIIASAIALTGAVAAMTLRDLVHCALALAATFASLAAIYLGLGAQFIGLAQLLVYVGAVAILVVFAILLTGNQEREANRWSPGWIWGVLASAALFALLAWAVLGSPSATPQETPAPEVTVRALGDQLMTRGVLPLEIIGLLLTGALIGAVVLAMREKEES